LHGGKHLFRGWFLFEPEIIANTLGGAADAKEAVVCTPVGDIEI
jgi:c-di-GMP-related signal transduction protein